MRTWWNQRALRTPSNDHQFSLEVHSCLFQLLKTLALEKLPDLLLRKILTLSNNGLLITIQSQTSVWYHRAMLVFERGHKGDLFCTLDPSNHLSRIQACLLHLRGSEIDIGPEAALD